MKNIIMALLCVTFVSMCLASLFEAPFGIVFTGVIALSLLAGFAAKQSGVIAFEALSPEILSALETLKKTLKGEISDSAKDLINKEIAAMENGRIKTLEDRIKFYDEERPKTEAREAEKQKEIDLMSAELKRLKEQGLSGAAGQIVSIQKQLDTAMTGKVKYMNELDKEAIEVGTEELVKDAMKRIKNSRITGFVPLMVLKASTDPILVVNSRSGGNVGITDFDTSFARVPQRRPFLRQIVNVRPTSKTYVAWAEQNHIMGSAGTTAESALKNQQSWEVVERNERIKKITLFDKTSKENLDDLPFMASEIRSLIIDEIARFLDSQILTGNNTGENLKGLTSYAPAGDISTSPLANMITGANNFDVIRALVAQIAVNGLGNFVPDYFLINPWDAAAMDMAKTSEGVYVMPPFITNGGQQIAGVLGIESTLLTQDKVMIGDFSKSNLALREDITISMGYDGNDFTRNLVTILGEMRALHYVKTNHVNAFAYGDFSILRGQLDTAQSSV